MPATLIKCGAVKCNRDFYPRQLTTLPIKKKNYCLCPDCLNELNEILQSKEKLDNICRRLQNLGEQNKKRIERGLSYIENNFNFEDK